jgi:DNA-binding winged helix-turn-helix (wHTH) protein
VLQREEIYQSVWGYAMAHGDRSVDVFVRKLRQKLETHSPGWLYIHTHFGIGYRFQPEPRDGDADAPTPSLEAAAPPGEAVADGDAKQADPANVAGEQPSRRSEPELAGTRA